MVFRLELLDPVGTAVFEHVPGGSGLRTLIMNGDPLLGCYVSCIIATEVTSAPMS